MSFTVFFFFSLSFLQLLLLDLFEGHLLHIKLGMGAGCGKETFERCTGWEQMRSLGMLCQLQGADHFPF